MARSLPTTNPTLRGARAQSRVLACGASSNISETTGIVQDGKRAGRARVLDKDSTLTSWAAFEAAGVNERRHRVMMQEELQRRALNSKVLLDLNPEPLHLKIEVS